MTSSKLFALGSNGSGQLGIGHKNDTAKPQLCQFEESLDVNFDKGKIVKIVAGGNHTLVLFESGALFAAGNNEHGQCCLPLDIKQSSVFRHTNPGPSNDGLASGDARICDISATWEASFLLGSDGQISVFGAGAKGELGLGEGISATANRGERKLVFDAFFDRQSRIRSFFSSMRHSIIIDGKGQAYGWGSCRKGELGPGLINRKITWTPEKLSVPFDCQTGIAGRNFTAFFGRRDCSVFGDAVGLDNISEMNTSSFDDIVSGWSTAYALVEKHIKTFGRSNKGQWPPADLPLLKKLAAGSEHVVALTEENKVISWGWGEHGNCGEPTNAHGIVAGKWNNLPIFLEDDEEVVNVAAGCATTFLVVEKKPS